MIPTPGSEPTAAMAEYPRRANLGCGYDRREGYLNVDFVERHEPDVVADVRDLSMLPSDYFEEVLAHDVLEHMPRADTMRALTEWARITKPGGAISIRVPSFPHLTELLFSGGDYQSKGFHEGVIQCAYGTQAYNGDFHLTSFTPLLLQQYLQAVNLYPQSARLIDGWMLEVIARKGVPATIDLSVAFGRRIGFVWRLTQRLVKEWLRRA